MLKLFNVVKLNNSDFLKAPLGVWGGWGVFGILILILSFSSCRKPRPQLPSNKATTEETSPVIDLMKINKKMVEKEDSLIALYVQENDPSFKKTEAGFWYKKEQTNQNRLLKKEDVCVIDYQLYLLDGTLLEEVNGFKITIGKKDFFPGLDEGLQLMRAGESATFIFPCNWAFGLKGYLQLVPSYTSIVFKVHVNM